MKKLTIVTAIPKYQKHHLRSINGVVVGYAKSVFGNIAVDIHSDEDGFVYRLWKNGYSFTKTGYRS